jgi:hypothetical protein
MMTGEKPEQIDHINGDKTDNRWQNLRNVSNRENCKNAAIGTNNTTGALGVWITRNGTYQADISVDGKKHYLGIYKTLEEAKSARKAAENKYGFHENHGRAP